MEKIQMVDLYNQYLHIKEDIDNAILECIESSQFIKGKQFDQFQLNLAEYLNVSKVIACGNGTDALQIAIMALGLEKGDEVIVPAFTYAATAEVIGLLGLTPVIVDVDYDTFNITVDKIKNALTNKTKLVVPVHLFGQCADMEPIIELANQHSFTLIEDTAQALGANYTFKNGFSKKAGCLGNIGCTSFFPSKNLGCFGDGGAVYTDDNYLAEKIKMIASHGQSKQYVHEVIGVNSRLDNIQASILLEKLKHLDNYNLSRQEVANFYDSALGNINNIIIPAREKKSTHVFHQYTIKVKNNQRDALKKYLSNQGIPSMIYYPKALHHQKAFASLVKRGGSLEISEQLCSEVLSLPIHTEMSKNQLQYIVDHIIHFFYEN
ncbi:DegT/DnrJ/EryC1/StrS aminotransferase family protein [Emticicia sp. BO119]|uniref:DegT/DnrJ/EryC1/StrS family aminotransferase n=1 Tax=Emticicia sp. BO119 TaxID=2757768 RepID=UPI0015F041D8|nr:DegT/DnrJ/EryC1/StrS family aminotransferase [Emticicia sp. BO119]MBA4854108.1 DegT/DnrJ/EryC1/StrS family aminotransferase [Emticicia sp. BO119]